MCTIRLLIKLIICLVPKRNPSAVAEFPQENACSENREGYLMDDLYQGNNEELGHSHRERLQEFGARWGSGRS